MHADWRHAPIVAAALLAGVVAWWAAALTDPIAQLRFAVRETA
jgi:hypothetical protein